MLDKTSLANILPVLPRTVENGCWSRIIDYHLLQGPPPGAPPGSPPQPLWPGGPPSNGARLTPIGSFGTIYLASDPITALREVNTVFTPPGLPPMTFKLPPWTVFAVEGIVTEVLDLTNANIQNRLNTSLQELTGDWQVQQDMFLKGHGPQPPTQDLGFAAHASGVIHAIKFPSAKNVADGINIAVFPDRLKSPEYLRVYDLKKFLVGEIP